MIGTIMIGSEWVDWIGGLVGLWAMPIVIVDGLPCG